jgi:serine/threonine protein kinase
MTISEATFSGVQLEIPSTIGRYKYVRTLGSGAWSAVVEVANVATNERLACKVVSRTNLTESGEFRLFEQELRDQQFLNHPNIVRIHDVVFKPDLVFVFLDLCAGGDLLTFLGDKSHLIPSLLKPMVSQILLALDYIHSRGITHRDIKPENILLTEDGNVKLGDFGLSDVESLPKVPKTSGTMVYAAPEVLLHPESVTMKADIWSFGILLFAMFSGRLPWDDAEQDALYQQITTRDFKAVYLLPRDVIEVFEACTQFEPEARPTAAQLLASPWLKQNSPQTLVKKSSSITPEKNSSVRLVTITRRPIPAGKSALAFGICHSVRPRGFSASPAPVVPTPSFASAPSDM